MKSAYHQTLRIYEVPTGKIAGYLEGHHTSNWEATLDVQFSPDGELVASASEDMTARLWEFKSRKPIGCFAHKERVGSVAFAPDGNRLITGCIGAQEPPGSFRGLQSFDFDGANVVQYELPYVAAPYWVQLTVSPDGRFLVAANGGERWTEGAGIWDWKTGKFVRILQVSEELGGAFDMAFTSDSDLLVTSHLKSICVWSTKTWECLSTIEAKSRMALSADNRFIAYQTEANEVEVRAFVRP